MRDAGRRLLGRPNLKEAESDVRSGHRERLRQKFLEHGLDKFTDEEIVEFLLTFGTPRRDCKQAARALLEAFGGIRSVFEAEPEALGRIKGVGPKNIVAIKFIHAAAGKFLEQRLVGRDYLSSSRRVHEYLKHSMENLAKEVFKVIYLDASNGVLALEDASRGTVGTAHVHPREIMERALLLRASGLVFAHNHPSGGTRPSTEDFRLTRQLVHAARLMEMRVVDHLVIGKNGDFFSFRDQGLLSKYENDYIKAFISQG